MEKDLGPLCLESTAQARIRRLFIEVSNDNPSVVAVRLGELKQILEKNLVSEDGADRKRSEKSCCRVACKQHVHPTPVQPSRTSS